MLGILSLVAPVFGLIALGFAAAKLRYMSDGAARVVNELGYKVAMPALLFRAMLAVGEVPVSPLWLVASYLSGIALIWTLATVMAVAVLRRPAIDAPSIAMGACFSNGVMLGFPIIITAFGPEAATPMAFLATCETFFLWLIATAHFAVAHRGVRSLSLGMVGGVIGDIARNPLIVAIAAGLACRYAGLTVPELPAKLIGLLAAAAVTVSLFGLGMSLAAYEIKGQSQTITVILLLKMMIYPIAALALATEVFKLPPLWAGVLVVYVAMPVGANAFVFASRTERAIASVSAAVAISTMLAVVTVTGALAVLEMMVFMKPV